MLHKHGPSIQPQLKCKLMAKAFFFFLTPGGTSTLIDRVPEILVSVPDDSFGSFCHVNILTMYILQLVLILS